LKSGSAYTKNRRQGVGERETKTEICKVVGVETAVSPEICPLNSQKKMVKGPFDSGGQLAGVERTQKKMEGRRCIG